jgi:hypothetical protein
VKLSTTRPELQLGSVSFDKDNHSSTFFKSEGFDTIDFEESVWRRPAGGKYSDDIYVSTHVDD